MENLRSEDTVLQTKSINSSKNSYIYIGLVDTPGLFASIIRRVIRQKYVHVVIGLDARLEEAYSVGRRNPAIPFFAGFEQEKKEQILKVFPQADYMVCRIACTKEQKEFIKEMLHTCMKERFSYHYTLLGLPFLLWNKPFYEENHYTCSSYAARLLEEAGVLQFDKHFSLVTPRDFMEYPDKELLFEGPLRELVAVHPVHGVSGIRKKWSFQL